MTQPTGVNAFVKLGFAHQFSYENGPFFPGGGEEIYWPELPSKSLSHGRLLLTDFSKNTRLISILMRAAC